MNIMTKLSAQVKALLLWYGSCLDPANTGVDYSQVCNGCSSVKVSEESFLGDFSSSGTREMQKGMKLKCLVIQVCNKVDVWNNSYLETK